ncbi:NmrA-domain-containing protein [Schizophyllum commune Tattone D]|nr:NmrA-domain-containing protein [Schizophyllum commune Tattone D]
MSKRILTILGATGKQGGSVVNSILGDAAASSKFSVRAVTRDVTKDSAKALAAKGAEVVSADLDDKNSLREAFKGAHGVFGRRQAVCPGKNIADACKEENGQHLVWSSLLNVNKLTNGVLSQVHHFDSKAAVEEYIRELSIPASFFLPGFYMSNIPGQNLRVGPDGKWQFAMPMPEDAPIPLFAAERDTGKFVKAMFLKREEVLGKRVYGATGYITPLEILDAFKKVYPAAGKDVAFQRLPNEAFKGILASMGLPEPIQEEMLQNMRLVYEFGYYGGEKLDWSKSLVDEPLTTWEEYIKGHPAFAAAQ